MSADPIGLPRLQELVVELDEAAAALAAADRAADTAWRVWELAQNDVILALVRHDRALAAYHAHRGQATS